jgi:hypothetical protein
MLGARHKRVDRDSPSDIPYNAGMGMKLKPSRRALLRAGEQGDSMAGDLDLGEYGSATWKASRKA